MATKHDPGNYFEDFRLDQELAHLGARTITEGDSALYISLTGDRYPLYCDRSFAQSLGYKQELVNDLLVFHIVFGKSVNDISLNAVANLGYSEVYFRAPVYPGDTLRAVSKVIGKKENSNGKTGIVYVHTTGLNQHDVEVLSFYRWVMVRKKDPSTSTGENSVPELLDEVPALGVDSELVMTHWNGSGRHFEDYEEGERIFHGGGMTIEEAEHATATRLYQNTARVHFDGHFMAQTGARRLMYGGHVISVARSLAFNGLENALRIIAWNGGAHAHPTYAGDTLYAFTDLLGTRDIANRDDVGALRLRLVALKNLDPQHDVKAIEIQSEKNGRKVYHENIVLDLDYYVLVPKRK